MSKYPKILVIRGGAIGDFIVTLPVFQALKSRWPNSHLEILGYPSIASLAQSQYAEKVTPLESPELARFFAPEIELDAKWRNYFSGFDIIISYLFDPDGIFHRNLERCGCKRIIRGGFRPENEHATKFLMKPLDTLGIFVDRPHPRLQATSRTSETTLEPGRRWLAAHPGSGGKAKIWPRERWAKLLKTILERSQVSLILLGGETDEESLNDLKGQLPPDRIRIEKNRTLVEVATLISQCAAYVGQDTGMTHLAAALGVPTLALFGGSSPKLWHPVGDNVKIIFRGFEWHPADNSFLYLDVPSGMNLINDHLVLTRLLEMLT